MKISKKFHEAQIPHEIALETTKGVKCEVLTRPIEKVGLYIPGVWHLCFQRF